MIQAPRGTKDIFGTNSAAWQYLEQHIRDICKLFGFSEIRTPIFEHTELFLRSVGETTDVVQKEMYTFEDKGNRSITMRPEMTAGAARAFIENGLHNEPLPAKLFYTGPNFRYERPGAGRLRQHHQFGIEIYGSENYAAEAEIMALGYHLLKRLNLSDVVLRINSLGCENCRPVYRQQLIEFISQNLPNLCKDCKTRYEKNPLRTLDCKVAECKAIMANAPSILHSLDDDCKSHFENLQNLLNVMQIPFVVDSKVVRGFDYYTRTVFEFIKEGLPTIIGGGRYDGLIQQLSNLKIPAVGFGMGMDRLLLLLESQSLLPDNLKNTVKIYIGYAGENGFSKSQELVNLLRLSGISAESDLVKRSVKAQMKYANKREIPFSMIIGDDEIANNSAVVKNMLTGEQTNVEFSVDKIAEQFGFVLMEG